MKTHFSTIFESWQCFNTKDSTMKEGLKKFLILQKLDSLVKAEGANFLLFQLFYIFTKIVKNFSTFAIFSLLLIERNVFN